MMIEKRGRRRRKMGWNWAAEDIKR